MSEVYETEEEQIDAIKRWWKENGRSIILGFVLGIGGIGGFRYWQSNVEEQAKIASMHFEEVVALSAKDKKEFIVKVDEVKTQHAGKSYADLSAFVAAKKLVEAKDYKAAKQQLEWVVQNSSHKSFENIARIRLVKIMLQLNETKAALDLIKDLNSTGFESTYAELRGDIYATLNEYAKSKSEYQLALNKLNSGDRRGAAIEMKSNNLPASEMPLIQAPKEK